MLGRLINGHQQTDPKRRVKAQEHRHGVNMSAKPPRVPQIVEQEIAPKDICLSPIILSPLNGQVKMSSHEQGDILFESERVATSGGDFSMYQGRGGVCQSRPAALLERAAHQALVQTAARRRGGGAGTRPSRPAQPPPPSR